ncbi:MAG: glycoside hydrolase family 3 N-terminal domain-containing protein [Bacillota bacterium]
MPNLLYAQLTLKQKIGQMLIVGFSGTTLSDTLSSIDTLKADLRDRNLGGVLEFAYNLSNPMQMKKLNDQLRQLASTPIFISTDQEGGSVARLSSSNGFSKTNNAYLLGTVYNREDSTRATAAMMSSWLQQTGFNVNFAPVVDVNINSKNPVIGGLQRSFSSNPLKVAEHAGYFIDESHKKNIITALKHFPGHGSSASDSHLGFTDITTTWADSELVPYKELISKGLIDIVMTGHLYNSKIDTLPATLSYKTVTGILRNQLGYNGVVISDEMSMGAISKYYGLYQAAVLAVNAGVDILLYNGNIKSGLSVVRDLENYLEQRVKDGTIAESRINEAYDRVLKLKNKYLTPAGVEMLADSQPLDFNLTAYPNPFNSSTKLTFVLRQSENVSLKIFDILGREVAALVINEQLNKGTYTYYWNAEGLSSGIYLASFQSGENILSKKIVLMK